MKFDNPYSRVDYRRLVAWPERIDREWPFLSRVLGDSGRVLYPGSGTGEHSRFIASKGFEVVGIDSSPACSQDFAPGCAPGLRCYSRCSTTPRREVFGTVGDVPFDPEQSPDLVIVAR